MKKYIFNGLFFFFLFCSSSWLPISNKQPQLFLVFRFILLCMCNTHCVYFLLNFNFCLLLFFARNFQLFFVTLIKDTKFKPKRLHTLYCIHMYVFWWHSVKYIGYLYLYGKQFGTLILHTICCYRFYCCSNCVEDKKEVKREKVNGSEAKIEKSNVPLYQHIFQPKFEIKAQWLYALRSNRIGWNTVIKK